MADNTLQFQWIVTIKENLEVLFRDRPDVFVAGDLLWYPVEGDPKIRTAPDAMVAFGRPKGYRGSYRQWEEGGIAPQVVFEVLSPGNRPAKMIEKFKFYERYGVEEYYIYDPDDRRAGRLSSAIGDELVEIAEMNGWISPLLGIRFDCSRERAADLRSRRPTVPHLRRNSSSKRAARPRARSGHRERDRIAANATGSPQERDRLLRSSRPSAIASSSSRRNCARSAIEPQS